MTKMLASIFMLFNLFNMVMYSNGRIVGGCRRTRYGCCTDGVTPARSWDDDCRLFGSCKSTQYGCCFDTNFSTTTYN